MTDIASYFVLFRLQSPQLTTPLYYTFTSKSNNLNTSSKNPSYTTTSELLKLIDNFLRVRISSKRRTLDVIHKASQNLNTFHI